MAGQLGFGWFAEYILNGVPYLYGSNARHVKEVSTDGLLHKHRDLTVIPAGQSAVLWQYEATNQGDTTSLRDYLEGLVEIDGSTPEGAVYLSWLVGRKTTGDLPLNLSTGAWWQGHLLVSCPVPRTFPMIGLVTPNDSRSASGSFPAIYTDASKEEGRVYRVAAFNPGTAAVNVRTTLWG